jgi:hypothetical protein
MKGSSGKKRVKAGALYATSGRQNLAEAPLSTILCFVSGGAEPRRSLFSCAKAGIGESFQIAHMDRACTDRGRAWRPASHDARMASEAPSDPSVDVPLRERLGVREIS